MNKRKVMVWAICLFFTICAPVYAHERSDGGYFTIVDESGSPVYTTGWLVKPGDQCLTNDNRRYEVVSVDGDIAQARFIGKIQLSTSLPTSNTAKGEIAGWLMPRSASAQGNKIAIYHTHSDESYTPSDGADSILGDGGVYQVGDAFASALQTKGLEVTHSNAKHDPHDDMAYERSRRTASDLLKQQPVAIFDIHRDSGPATSYATNINGQDVSKVQLVVGKYGPTGKQIEDYAMQIKAAADQQHPGLIKGIFFAKGGDYNQDLFPRSMLLEVGTQNNTKGEAERGIALFADVVPTIIGQTSGGPSNANAPQGATGFGTQASGASGATKSIGWILGLLVVGGAAFLFISTGSMKEAGSKLKQFSTEEFANFLGSIRLRRKGKNNRDGDDETKS